MSEQDSPPIFTGPPVVQDAPPPSKLVWVPSLRDPSAPTEEEIAAGVVIPPRPTGDAAVLAAFREVTGWTDEEVLHYATCRECDPRDGDYTWYCENSPNRRREREEQAAAKRRYRGEPSTPQSPLAAALRRAGEQLTEEAKRQVPRPYWPR